MPHSPDAWKRTPTTADVFLAVNLPYRPPKSPLGAFVWRRRMWLETTTGLSLLEPWEKLLTRASPCLSPAHQKSSRGDYDPAQ